MKTTLLITLLSLTALFSSAQQCSYSNAAFTASAGPNSIATGDFNNDGNKDLLVGAQARVLVYLGNGAGVFTPTTSVINSGSVIAVKSCFLNSDTNLDFIFVTLGGNAFVALGSGLGTFTVGGAYPGCTLPQNIIIDDFNNDSNLDLVIADGCSPAFHRYIGLGNGTFATATSSILIMPGGSSSTDGVSGDFNGDGIKDLILSNYNTKDISVFLGTATNSFAPAMRYTVGTQPQAITKGDFNKDGNMDLATANEGADSVAVLFGNGAGAFSSATWYFPGLDPRDIETDDLDGDGNLDLVVANTGTNSVTILYGSASGVFQMTVNTGMVGQQPTSVVLADFNGDQRPDLAATNRLGNTVSLALSGYPVISLTSPTAVCSGQNFTMSANVTGAMGIAWSTGATSSLVTTSFTSATSVTVIATSPASCITTKTLFVSVLAVPQLTVTGLNAIICKGQTVQVTADGAQSYSWNGGATSPSLIINPQATTAYTVTGTGANGCSSKSVYSQTVSSCFSIEKNTATELEVALSPNPNAGHFQVLVKNGADDLKITIINAIGQTVHAQQLSGTNHVDLPPLPVGVYFYHLSKSGNTVHQGKFILQ